MGGNVTLVVDSSRSLADRIKAIAAPLLRVRVEQIGPFDRFASLGMDSLLAMELTAAIEDELGIELPMTALYDCPDLETLCRLIEEGGASAAQRAERMREDAILPAGIAPSGRGIRTRDVANVLLTGATGFVGAFLLRAMLDRTTARVRCLVRARDGNGIDRIRKALSLYGLRTDDLGERVLAIESDIAEASLGLGENGFQELSANVDAIYHAAADVNWVRGYDALRDVNVLGTRELLRLACTGTPKPMHFLSSISVCHSTLGPRTVDETCDPMSALEGVRLGYAQSKCVAEALVRSAGERGLPVTIIRPSLVTGDARTGRSNLDDLTSRFIAGCIELGAAPDLDWRMDCVPVDDAARAILEVTRAHDGGMKVFHLTADSPRHWRECVLWMRLGGYRVDLVPYREWAELLRSTDASHPLSGLRAFFLHAIASENHLTLPELLEESRRTRVTAAVTSNALTSASRALDSRLLARYFDDFVARGAVPESDERLRDGSHASLEMEGIELAPMTTDDSIVAELTSLRGHAATGLFRGIDRDGQRVFVKAKPADTQTIDVARALAKLASPALGKAVETFRDYLGFTKGPMRELAIYSTAGARLREHLPRVVHTESDEAAGRWVLALEWIDDAILMNATDPALWSDDAIDAALVGLANIHAVWFGRERELSLQPWMGPVRDASQRERMTSLWEALLEHACAHSLPWRHPRLRRIHQMLIADIRGWATALDALPTTLVHNDFNPRNIAMRGTSAGVRLCAFDWELATIGIPQRDLVELLCFVLPSTAPAATVRWWSERYRTLLSASTQTVIERTSWNAGLRAALADVLVDRFASYAMIDRVRPQRFLTYVTESWLNLHSVYPWNG